MIKLGADANPDPMATTHGLSLEEDDLGSLQSFRR